MPPRGYMPILEQVRIGTKDGEIIGVLHNTAGMPAYEDLWITKVIFNDPATIVFWSDGKKTVVKCQTGDIYSKETGLALCVMKRVYGNKSRFNDVLRKFIPEYDAIEEEVEFKSSLGEAADALKGALAEAGEKISEAIEEVTEKRRGRTSKIDDGRIMALAKANRSAQWIADDMGISVATVFNHIKKLKAEGRL